MNGRDIIAFINDKTIDLTEEELKKVIDEEIEKGEKADTELIEYCLDALNEKQPERRANNSEKRKRKQSVRSRSAFRRSLVAAAVVAVIISVTIPVYALNTHLSLFDSFVEFYNNYVAIRFDNTNHADGYGLLDTELAEELKQNGFYPVLLPEAIFGEDSEITKVEYQYTELLDTANINFTYKGHKGHITFSLSHDMSVYSGKTEIPNARLVDQFESNGISILIFKNPKCYIINYNDGNIEYSISISASEKKAIEFAATIK